MFERRDVLRAGLAAASLCLAWPARAQQGSYISRKLDARVPGGVAVLTLGDAASAPEVTYQDRRVLVVREQGKQWIAVVDIPLSVKPGQEHVQVKDAAGTRQVAFSVGAKDYVAQHITLKNRRQVDPNPDDLKRIERELAEQIEACAVPSGMQLRRRPSCTSPASPVAAASMLENTGMPSALICSTASAGP